MGGARDKACDKACDEGCDEGRDEGCAGQDEVAASDSSDKMTLSEWLPLIGLTFAAFIFNTSEFMPIGLLTDVAADFGVSEARVGMIITVYAWVVMATSLPLMMLASRVPFRRLLLGVVALFGVGQVLSVLATGYWTLMAARVVVACAHAVFWSIASPMAVRVVSVRHHSLALSMIVTGTSVAMVFGLPLGRIVGLWLGWRAAFGCVAVASFVVLAYLALVFPRMAAGEPFTLAKLPGLFSNRPLVSIFVFIALIVTAYYTGYSYVEPFMQQVAGMDDGPVTFALTLFGVAGIVGSLLFARLYDGHHRAFILAAVGGLVCALALMLPAAMGSLPDALPSLLPSDVLPNGLLMMGVCMLWGASATAFNVALQGEVINHTEPDESAVAMSIYSGIFNLGIGCGSWLGGLVVTHASVSLVGVAGALLGAVAFAYCALRSMPLLEGKARG